MRAKPRANGSGAAPMTKGEREELLRLIKQREKLGLAAAAQRSAELLAEFEQQIAAIYHFDQDDVWQQAMESAEKIVAEANAAIAKRCAELGILKEFAPEIRTYWLSRGENAVKERRAELSRVAKKKVEAIEAGARTRIQAASVEAQTEVVTNGLTSDSARRFLERMPRVDTLMPSIAMWAVKAATATPAS